MDSTPIHTLVAMQHARGVLLRALGLEEIARRTLAVAIRNNSGDPNAPRTFYAFVQSCYYEGLNRPHIPLINGAIAFYARQNQFQPATSVHTYPSSSGQKWYILDVETDDPSRIVPLGIFIPYLGRGSIRTAITLEGIDPVPMWVVREDVLGVRLGSDKIKSLQHGDRRFTHTNGNNRTTVSVKVNWPGYKEWESQARMKCDFYSDSRPGDSYTFTRLVNQVQNKIRKFLSDHSNVASGDPHWAVGNAYPGRITIEDLVLLAIVVVSKGAVMPILKVRDDFLFSDTITPHSVPSASATLEPSRVSTAIPATNLPLEQFNFNANGRTFEFDQLPDMNSFYTDGHAHGNVNWNHAHLNHRYSNSTVSPDVWW